jgi:hypothetical protein
MSSTKKWSGIQKSVLRLYADAALRAVASRAWVLHFMRPAGLFFSFLKYF